MKKLSIRKKVAIAAALVILLVIVVLLRSQPRQAIVPAFKFLSGREPIAQIEMNHPIYREIRFVYSFEADFDDMITDANSELSNLGYFVIPNLNGDFTKVVYRLSGKKINDEIVVSIVRNQKMDISPPPKNFKYETPVSYIYLEKEGWVSIVIIQKENKNWFIRNFTRFMYMLRNK